MEQSSFFNAELTDGKYDREYNATDWAAYFATFVGNGVSCTPDTNLQVESSSGMSVIVNPGIAFINGYRYENTTPLTVEINQANSTYDRITSIILELNLNNRNIICKTIDGTAEPNPQSATLTRTNSVYQLQLGTVYISAGATNCGAITDTRENKEVCGFLELLAPTIPPQFIKNVILQGTITNDATINGGTYNNPEINYPKVIGGDIKSVGITDSNFYGDINNSGTVNGGIYNNPTLQGTTTTEGPVNIHEGISSLFFLDNIGKIGVEVGVHSKTWFMSNRYTDRVMIQCTPVSQGVDTLEMASNVEFNEQLNVNNGLYNKGNPVVNASTINLENMHIQDNVTGTIHVEYWALNAGLLSATPNSLLCGIIKATVTLDQSCTWNNQHPIYLNVQGFPQANAMTVTYSKNFVIGSGQNVIVLNGNSAYLNANQAYTEYALVYG